MHPIILSGAFLLKTFLLYRFAGVVCLQISQKSSKMVQKDNYEENTNGYTYASHNCAFAGH